MFAFIKGVPNVLASPYAFARHGDSGAEISELLPHLASVADELCDRALDAHDAVQPRAGAALPAHRHCSASAGRASARG
jgi:hypothetical protein